MSWCIMFEYSERRVHHLALWHKLHVRWPELRDKIRVGNVVEFIRKIDEGVIRVEDLEKVVYVDDSDVEEVKKILASGVKVIPIISPEYPQSLRSLEDKGIYPPLVIYCKGNLNFKKCIAIVGTRFCTNWGRNVTRELVRHISKEISEASIVTGFARGIDTEATESALKYGLKVVGVLPWLMPVYPPENERLANEVVGKGGAILSENLYKPSSSEEIRRQLFLRNRIISSLADVVIVVEARLHYVGGGKYRGGAMWQVEYALKRGKKVYIIEPKYRAYKIGNMWVNYRKAFEVFVRHGAVPFNEEEIEELVKTIKNELS